MSYYAIYAGHGGSDPGATSGSRLEKDYTLGVANALSALLRVDGNTVVQNRATDIDRNITTDANRANSERVNAIIELHMNSNAGTPGKGTEVYYYPGSATGEKLAESIQRQIVNTFGYADRGAKSRSNLGILRQSNMPAVLVEMAFINNDSDMAKFDAQRMAEAIRQGIYDTFGGTVSDNTNNNENSTTPGVDNMTELQARAIAREEIETYFSNLETKSVSSWAEKHWKNASTNGVTDGTKPQTYATREQVITFLGRLGLLEED